MVHTEGGERYIPNYIENRLKFSPYVKDAAVLGTGRDDLAAIVCIDMEAVGHWAEVRGISYMSYADLSQRPEVSSWSTARSRTSTRPCPRAWLRRFVSLHKEFDADDGEITRTRKLRRNVVEERYAPIIDALYGGAAAVDDEARITYESGEAGVIERRLTVTNGRAAMDWSLFAELAINGALVGLMYSLVALGIVLVYKSSALPTSRRAR